MPGESQHMTVPDDWSNPIAGRHGETQAGVIPEQLLPSRQDLLQSRLDHQIQLMQAGVIRWTPILVTPDGVIIDGHHAVRAAAELGELVSVRK